MGFSTQLLLQAQLSQEPSSVTKAKTTAGNLMLRSTTPCTRKMDQGQRLCKCIMYDDIDDLVMANSTIASVLFDSRTDASVLCHSFSAKPLSDKAFNAPNVGASSNERFCFTALWSNRLGSGFTPTVQFDNWFFYVVVN